MAPARLDLLTAGDTFDDLVFYRLSRLPDAGQELKTSNFYCSPGGGALITAVAAARLGLRCGVVSGLSDGSARLLRREGVLARNLRARSEPPAITVALSSPGDRRFITFGGVNERLPGRIRRALSRARTRHVHFAFVPRPCRPWLDVVNRLRRRGITTSWDFGWDDRLARDPHFSAVAESVDYLFLNRDETLMYSGTTRLGTALERWRRAPRHVVVKLGASGSRLVGGGVDVRAPATRVRSVDSTGAGDAFNGGFLTARLHGRPLRAALVLGNRVGALSTRRAGGIAGLPRRQQQT